MGETVRKNMLCFVSSNSKKLEEVETLFTQHNMEVACVPYKINEIQCLEMKDIVADKVKKAFYELKRPVFVEQTGLYIEEFGRLPGGLTEIMWESLGAEKFCGFFGRRKNVNAKAVTVVGYCDGKSVMMYETTIDGRIASKPEGDRDYQWDCIFIPTGQKETVAVLQEKKLWGSIRHKALALFIAEYVRNVRGGRR
ncbi:non-canonical purine NTP pyrophosphatase [[Clostridium] polysaccharolyticum]|uniref:XTP/dITP diphosphohydrolase n=1 Tax=[Clostridium] polysaccharolyticum TaxID=29364 RepID=A0A1I0FIR3_9FIRM|nr:non-canonical purine NTP pyrophosphatase [[Clostridium] polysaccharolyticum]SET57115.1 XTP/dITP diphosphohydrolase [[Clostridium] polysaccharolyticum]